MKGSAKKICCEEGGFLDFLRPLMTACLPLMKSVLTRLIKSVLIPLRLTAAATATTAAIQKKIYGSGTTAPIISNEEIDDVMIIVKSLEESGLLIKDVSEAIQNEVKGKKCGFLGILLGTLSANILEYMLAGEPQNAWMRSNKSSWRNR